MIDGRLLRSFLVVAEELHFGRAAQRLHLTQPPLTRQIQQLEEDLGGILLFDRSRRRISLTEAGRTLRDEGSAAMARLAEAAERTKQVARGERGRVRIGFVSTADYSILPKLLRSFTTRHPGIELDLVEATGDEQERLLDEGTLDVGFVLARSTAPERGWLRVHREPLVAVLPRTPPWTRGKGALPCRRLADQPFVLFPRLLAPALYDAVISHARRAGFHPNITREARQMQTIIGLVAGGLGVSIVPACMRNLQRPDVVYRPLEPPTPEVSTYLTWHTSGTTAAVESLLRIVRSTVGKSRR